MAPEVRTVLRKIDEFSIKKDIKALTKEVSQAISAYDKERDYSKSISVLEKLVENEFVTKNNVLLLEFQSHLLLRYLLNNQFTEAKEIRERFNPNITLPLANLTSDLLEYVDSNISAEYVVQSIEKKSLFGAYESLPYTPSIRFDSEDDAMRILEDYFPSGKYIVNLVQNESQLLHSIKVDVGTSHEVNVLENRRTFRIK